MISSWNDCVAKWVRAGLGGKDSLAAADAWEERHREIDRQEEAEMLKYSNGCPMFTPKSKGDQA